MDPRTTISTILEYKGREVYSISPSATVCDAVRSMNERKIGALLVINNGKPVGMFTERDVLSRVIDTDRKPAETTVGEVMSRELVVIKPGLSIEDAMQVITQKRCRHLPVMENDQLLGMISIGDLMRWIVREHESYIDNLLEYLHSPYPA